ncbi:MAG: hypothetical protein ABIR32_14330 [Ilumatobacteraceae bacterium]
MTTSSLSINQIGFPPRNATMERAETAEFLTVLRAWLSGMTDRVFGLDAQWQTIGPDASPDEQADVAAAFLTHQAIGTRITEMGTPDGQKVAVELCHGTVLAADGTPVAANLSDACTLLEAVITRAETSLAHTATTVHETVRLRSAINADLNVAEHLAQRLGDQVRHINALNTRAMQAMSRLEADKSLKPDTAELTQLSSEIAAVRASLEAADTDRHQLISSWSSIPARLDQLRVQEASVRALRTRCEDKVRPVPKFAIPSVDALVGPIEIDQLELQPWRAIEPTCRAYLQKLDRVQAALDEVQKRFSTPLGEREDLRGLVQAFHDKAGDSGLGEHPDLDRAYRSAVDVLWSAPCDLVIAKELVERYMAVVNAITNGETARVVSPGTGQMNARAETGDNRS